PASPTAVSARASMPAAVTSYSSRRRWDRDRKPATFSSLAASTPIWQRFSACSAKGSRQDLATSSSLATEVAESRCARSPAAPARPSPRPPGHPMLAGKTDDLKSLTHTQFFEIVASRARKAMATTVVTASETVAQVILETGRGNHTGGPAKNLFGIKGKGPAG